MLSQIKSSLFFYIGLNLIVSYSEKTSKSMKSVLFCPCLTHFFNVMVFLGEQK